MLKDCTFLRSGYVKYRCVNEPLMTRNTEQLFQPKTPMPPMRPPIYGAYAGKMPSDGSSALKNCERMFLSLPVTVAPELETRLANLEPRA